MKTRKIEKLQQVSLFDVQQSSVHAPGQYLGYSLQTTRFLVRLLEADSDWIISLEAFEDVGVEKVNSEKIAEQVKSTLEGNPVSNHAVDLWKTFSNWVNSVKSGEIKTESTQFVLYVSNSKTGTIIESFSKAKSHAEAQSALLEAKKELFGYTSTISGESKLSDSIKPYAENVFGSDEDIICSIVEHFNLECGSGSPQQDLKEKFAKTLMFLTEENINVSLNYALGWVKEQIDRKLEQKKPASIAVREFRTVMASFIQKYNCRAILRTFAGSPSHNEIQEDLRVRGYVRQLDIIDADDEQKIKAVKDYLRASVDRTEWSVRGLVHESSFDEFEEVLQRTWDSYKRKTDIFLTGHSPIEKGQYLYSECSCHQTTLEGLQVPPHFTPGSFHSLADAKIIGWHPNYEDILKAVPDVEKSECTN
ncbi:ABC-three component system protein [Dehalococcoides mccartyi]|uniref:ABC-three component system protein n=1 Tax=Dehalococcoides mccartyi TaxID=61435 RepID=A0AB38Z7Z1_9CHLR|nr:ABC-three component system protein [Dehalococcoides mccartyi]WRO06709.1 ABC-three component system protein [Dehalococcoides mccartyi]